MLRLNIILGPFAFKVTKCRTDNKPTILDSDGGRGTYTQDGGSELVHNIKNTTEGVYYLLSQKKETHLGCRFQEDIH